MKVGVEGRHLIVEVQLLPSFISMISGFDTVASVCYLNTQLCHSSSEDYLFRMFPKHN